VGFENQKVRGKKSEHKIEKKKGISSFFIIKTKTLIQDVFNMRDCILFFEIILEREIQLLIALQIMSLNKT
jgi:hypothetical protein